MSVSVGLIGCGRWGRFILRDLVACGATVHVAVQGEDSHVNAREFGAASIHPDIDALPEVDGYVVATPSSTHAAVLDRLIETGKRIFVEKPMTTDLESARRIADRAGDRVCVMDKWRYHPGIEAMRVEIAEGRVGDVLSIRTERWGWGNPHPDTTGLWILAPHDLSIAQHLVGTIPPLRRVVPLHPNAPHLGLTAHLGGSSGPTISMALGIASPSHRRHCLVVGTRATLELRGGYETTVYVRDGAPGDADAVTREIEVGDAMPLLEEVRSFVAWLDGGPPPLSPASDALEVVKRITEIEEALT